MAYTADIKPSFNYPCMT